MRRRLIRGVIVAFSILAMSFTSFADSAEAPESTSFQGVPSWDYENNDNVPGFVDKNGDPIPNIHTKNGMILVDVHGGYKWAREAVTYCAEQGYLDGMLTREYFFRPHLLIDKSDLAVFLGRVEKIEYSNYTKNYFFDVLLENSDLSGDYDYTDWYGNFIPYYVNWAGEEGILKGSGGGVLNHTEPVNREEAAAMFDRYISKKTTLYEGVTFDGGLTYSDQGQISEWAKESVARLSKIKLFKGDHNGNFNPKSELTRAEICQVIYNLDLVK